LLLNDLYIIESKTVTDHQILAIVKLNADHAIFKGHFPGHPVLPGVCMMEMISEIMGKILEQSFRISGVPMIKFLRMIDPNRNPTLSMEINYQPAPEYTITNGKIYSGSEVFMKFQLILLPDPV
jgi:3-hydroxyacyl-[acyl-carrier-protein] dehydratase